MYSIYLVHLKMQITHTNIIDLLIRHIIVYLNKHNYLATGSTFIFDRGKFCQLQQSILSEIFTTIIIYGNRKTNSQENMPSPLKSLNKRNNKKEKYNLIFQYARKIYGFRKETFTVDIIRSILADNPSTCSIMDLVYRWREPKDISSITSTIHFIFNEHPSALTLEVLGEKNKNIDLYDNLSMTSFRRLNAGMLLAPEQAVKAAPLRDWASKKRTTLTEFFPGSNPINFSSQSSITAGQQTGGLLKGHSES